MAQGKETVVIYKDWKNIFSKLSDEEAGKLIKHFFSYINDENPILENRLLDIVFEPIKMTLKRDLKHWELVKLKRSESGRLGGLESGKSRKQNEANEANACKTKQNEANEANACKTKQNEANEAVSVTDNVTVIDNDKIKKEKKSMPKKSASPTLFENPSTPYEKFNNWIINDYPNVSKLNSQMTENEMNLLLKKYGKERLYDILEQMENKKDLCKKYNSVYLTANNWLKR